MFLKIVGILLAIWAAGLTCLLLLGELGGWQAAVIECLLTGALAFAVLGYLGLRFGKTLMLKRRRGEGEPTLDANAVILIVAAGLLMLPGLISDVAGALLLLPPVRRVAVARLRRRYVAILAALDEK